jgi:NADPH-dependent ferric siderophore reductase
MTDTAPAPAAALQLPAEFLAMMKKRGLRDWRLTVAAVEQLTPRMRRLSLGADDLGELQAKAGQDMLFMLPDGADGLARRHYTVRRVDRDARRIDVDVVLHGDSTPGTRWALDARPGDGVLAFGPRGRNVIEPGADWRLFVGDETCIPAIFAMLETLPPGAQAHAIIEVAADDDRQTLTTAAKVDIDWISRGGAHAGPSSKALIERLSAWPLPAGRGHVYVLGETSTIRRQRHDLLARGVAKDQIFGEGYWRPGRVGGHDHLEEH